MHIASINTTVIVRYTSKANNLYYFSNSKLILCINFRSEVSTISTAINDHSSVPAAVTTVHWNNSQFCSTFSHSMTKPLAVGTGGNRLYPALLHCFTNYLIASFRFIPITTLTTSSEFVMGLSFILRFPFMSWTHTARCFGTLATTWTYTTNNAAVCYSKTTTYNMVSWLKKTTKWWGGVHVWHYVCVMVQNPMRNSLFVPKNDVSPTEKGDEVGETYLKPRFQERWIGQ